ncbi:MAG: GNAT family N-acetyltransferase [Microbacterium sp.]|uniref:GNAT family N-acetyltransferase n=1 Tax=Microbacterium sp. TaxID=51671 RepID=UPI001AD020A5|nr:GNAT family N-acetyltransferase [Microbacterium sp.]MBN9153421.1 GNAT family N-acetyltransferase [Microbacterium sp.]MBN9189563.1 GNAT family N-acetyltransferase [Microbacterium sp.]
MSVVVRAATRADARAIAFVRVHTWRAAYAGLIDPVLLDRMDVDREAQVRAERWNEYTADPRTTQLVAEIDGAVVGWASTGPSRDDDGPDRGELYAIYSLPSHWSTGVGHALVIAAEHALTAAGYRKASLWVLDGNDRAAAFYERHGWREDGAVKDDARIVGDTGVAPLRERRRVRTLGDGGSPEDGD